MLWETRYRFIFWARGQRDVLALIQQVSVYLQAYGIGYTPLYMPSGRQIQLDKASLLQDPYWGERLRKHDINSIWLRSENGFVLDFNLNMPSHQTIFLPQVMQFGFELVHFRDANFSKPISQLHELFVFGLQLFQPFYAWGTMSGEVNYSEEYRKRPSLRETDLPPVVEWFNYYDSSIVERLGGLEKLLSAPVFLAEPVEDLGAVILILQQEPFDYTNPDHLQNRRRVEEYLELPRLHQQFQKS